MDKHPLLLPLSMNWCFTRAEPQRGDTDAVKCVVSVPCHCTAVTFTDSNSLAVFPLSQPSSDAFQTHTQTQVDMHILPQGAAALLLPKPSVRY